MSTNKIALTASMRSNLLSLKNTQKLFDSTQDKLSTGYKVNSAMDNPSSYFTAQSLNARADDLSTLLDSIGQAISTLQTADEGITSLQDFVSQAKSIANSARDTMNVSAKTTSTIKFDKDNLKSQLVSSAIPNANVAAGKEDSMVIRYGDSTKLTGTTNVKEDSKLSELGLEGTIAGGAYPGLTDAGSIKIDGNEYKLAVKGAANQMVTSVAENAVLKISAHNAAEGTYTLTDANGSSITFKGTIAKVGAHEAAVGDTVKIGADFANTVSEKGITTYAGDVTLTDNGAGAYAAASLTTDKLVSTTINIAQGQTVEDMANVIETMIGTKVFDVSIEDSNLVFKTLDTTSVEVTGKIADVFGMDKGVEVKLEATDTAESLRQKIDALEGISAEFDENGKLVVKSAEGDDMVISGALADKLGISGAVTNGSNERATYAKQFDSVLKQIDELVQDTSYKGINLLKGDNLTVVFNESRTSTLELKGVTFDSTGLGFTQSANEWMHTDDIDTALDQITKATSTLRAQASEFGQNLSTVQIREDFTENMINNLTTGADKLTLADANEEAANLLALQTRQSLATNSLSLASQSAQSVLKLF